MLSNVPQFIDIEDKIVGPFTAKQLGWLAAGAVVLFFTWNLLDSQAFFVSLFFVGFIFGSLAFYRPHNQPLISFIFSSVSFVLRPKIYIWKRIFEIPTTKKKSSAKKTESPRKKGVDQKKIEEISKMLDSK